MAQYDHLPLVRLPEHLDRRKTGRAPLKPNRGVGHGAGVRGKIEQAVEVQRNIRPPEFVDPSLILKVEMHGMSMEDDWEGVGLRLLSSDDDNTLVLFSSTEELTEFRRKLAAYEGPKPFGQKDRRFAGFIDRIENISTLEPVDRLGIRLLERGFTDVTDFQDGERYLVDIELWDFAGQAVRRRKAEEIGAFIEAREGEVYDVYAGPSLTILRVHASGSTLRPILFVPEVATVDHPPEPDLEAQPIVQMALAELPAVDPIPPDAPIVAVLDSGINAHPLLDDVLVASESFIPGVGPADVWGHGTKVGGTAVFGDLREQVARGRLHKSVRLVSAKIITDDGQFYDRRTLPNQMRTVFESLHDRYGCRIFVLSLGDKKAWFERGRVGP